MNLRSGLILQLLCFLLNSWSQETPDYSTVDKIIADLIENVDEETDYSILTEDIYTLFLHPVNINKASYDDLKKLYFLNDFQIKSILDYIRNNGPVVSVYELNYVFGLNEEISKLLSCFVYVENSIVLGKHLQKRNESLDKIKSNLEQQKASSSINQNSYVGSPYSLRFRTKLFPSDKLSIGINGEKDYGEDFFSGSNPYGFDHTSAYFELKNAGKLKKMIVGDYTARFGQGLSVWNGSSLNKSGSSTSIIKRISDVDGYNAADENIFFRGVAGNLQFGSISVMPFVSYKKVDATIKDSVMDSSPDFSSFQVSGLHRTQQEIKNEKSIGEIISGTHLSYESKLSCFGISLVQNYFTGNCRPDSVPYKFYDFSGNRLTTLGTDWRILSGNCELFGEATGSNNKFGVLAGCLVTISNISSITLVYRNYRPGFYVYKGNPFSEYSDINDEEGLYIGSNISLSRKIKMSASCDFFNSKWMRYRLTGPSFGKEYIFEIKYTKDVTFSTCFRLKTETKFRDQSNNDNPVAIPTLISKTNLRLNTDTKFNNLQLRNRIEICYASAVGNKPETGFLAYQDIIYSMAKVPVKMWFRYTIFDSYSFDTRIYSYENSPVYSCSIPFLYGCGARVNALLKFDITRNMQLWLKYAATKYSGNPAEKESGSTNNPSIHDFEMQLFMRF